MKEMKLNKLWMEYLLLPHYFIKLNSLCKLQTFIINYCIVIY